MKTLTIAIALSAAVIFPASVTAQGIPTIDVANIVQTTTTALNTIEQLEQMRDSYTTQLDELQRAIQQVDALTGNRGIGNLLNSAADRDLRRYTPTTWQDTMRILDAGGLPGSAADVRAAYQTISNTLNVANAADINRVDAGAPNAIAFEQRRDTAFAAGAVAETSYNQSLQRVEDYERLMIAIENTPDSKAAADLANRIAAQNGLTQSELIKLQSVRLQQQAAADNQDLVDATINARLAQYRPSRLGENITP